MSKKTWNPPRHDNPRKSWPIESDLAQFGQVFGGVQLLKSHKIAISMDSKGAWRDNVFVERLWRTIKYEEVYVRVYTSVSDARASIGRYIDAFIIRAAPIRALTAPPGRGLLYNAAINPDGSLTKAIIHFASLQKLFKQTEPALHGRMPAHPLVHEP